MFIMGLVTGAVLGETMRFLLLCVAIAGDRTEGKAEYQIPGNRRGMTVPEPSGKGQRRIQFVDSDNRESLWIEDGEKIELFTGNGERQTCLCRYLDKRHVSINGTWWEMLAFARWMRKRGITYIPSAKTRGKEGAAA